MLWGLHYTFVALLLARSVRQSIKVPYCSFRTLLMKMSPKAEGLHPSKQASRPGPTPTKQRESEKTKLMPVRRKLLSESPHNRIGPLSPNRFALAPGPHPCSTIFERAHSIATSLRSCHEWAPILESNAQS